MAEKKPAPLHEGAPVPRRAAPNPLPSSAAGAEADPRITHESPSFKVKPRPNVDASVGRALGGTAGGSHTFEKSGRRFSD